MELYQLRTFVAVAEEGNFTRAGKRVHATQPAVSAHIKALEEELGVRLFNRVVRGVELTEAGARLVESAIEVLDAANAFHAKAVSLSGEVSGNLTLGLCADPEFLKVMALLTSMGDQFPKLSLNLVQSPSGVILNKIRAKELDAGFVFSGNPYNDLKAIKLYEPEYSIMAAAFLESEIVDATAEKFSSYTWVLPTSNCPFRELQIQVFNEHGITPSRTIGADSEEVVWPLIAEGKALGIMREDEVSKMVEAGLGVECHSLGRHPVELNFVYRSKEVDDPSVAALIEIVRDTWGA